MTMHEGENGEVMPAMTEAEAVALAQQLYVAYYGRPADPGGLAFWTEEFMNSDNLDNAIAAFGNSAEYEALSMGMENADLVTALYQQMFNRDPMMEGLDFYVGRLESGEATLASIAKQIADGAMDSDDAKDATTLANKVAVANAFTAAVVEGVVYDAAAIPAAADLLASVDAADGAVDAGVASIAALVELFDGGKEYTLTASRDTLDSGYGDDTFTATSTTIQANDVIEDASTDDMDVLNISNTGGGRTEALHVRGVETINISQDLFDGVGTDNANAVNLSNVRGAEVTVSSEKLGFDGMAMIVGLRDNMLTVGARVNTVVVGDVDDATIDLGMAKTATICTIATTANGLATSTPADIAKDKTGSTIMVNGDVTLTVKGSATGNQVDATGGYSYANAYTIHGTADATVKLNPANTTGEELSTGGDDLVSFTVGGTGDMKLELMGGIGATAASKLKITDSKESGSLTVLTADVDGADVSGIGATVHFTEDQTGGMITAADGQSIVFTKAQTFADLEVKGSKATDDLTVTAMAGLAGITFNNAASATLTVAGDKAVSLGALGGTVPVSVVSAAADVTVTGLTVASADFSGVAGKLTIGGITVDSEVAGGSGSNTVTAATDKTLGYTGGDGTDVIVVAGLDSASGGRIGANLGAGNDSISFAGALAAASRIEVDGGIGIDAITLVNGANIAEAGAGVILSNFEALVIADTDQTKDNPETDAIEGMNPLAATVALSQLKDISYVALGDSKTRGGDGADTATIAVVSGATDAMIDLSHLSVVETNVSFTLTGTNVEAGTADDAVTTIIGSSSSDTITGGASDGDTLTGGGGADTFVFAANDSYRGADATTTPATTLGYDTITDFMKGKNDKLNLDAVNLAADTADAEVADGEAFTGDALAVFTGSTGVTYVIEDGVLTLKGTSSARGQANTLEEWITLAQNAGDDGLIAFQFGGDTYIHEGGGTTSNLIKLQGVTGVTSLVNATTNFDDDATNDVMVDAGAIQIIA